MVTRKPAWLQVWAMPAPMVPAPRTAIRLMSSTFMFLPAEANRRAV